MLTLDPTDVATWNAILPEVVSGRSLPGGAAEREVSLRQLGAFRFFAGAALARRGDGGAQAWFDAGAAVDGDSLRASDYLRGVLRRGEPLPAAEEALDGPGAWFQLSRLPPLQAAREEFVSFAVDSLPSEAGPLRVLDLGGGDGSLLSRLLRSLVDAERWDDVTSITLLDPAPARLQAAKERLATDWPRARVEGRIARFENVASLLAGPYDLAVGAFSLHQLPAEVKRRTLSALAPAVTHLLLLELDADHDSPQAGSPELAASVHQTYGWLLAQALAPGPSGDGSWEEASRVVGPELVSMLTRPRGLRAGHHMRRDAWLALLCEAMGPDTRPLGIRTALSTPHAELVALHVGRLGPGAL